MRIGLVLEILLKVLYELGRGRFCWLFGDFLKAMRSHGRMPRREGPICCHLERDLGLGAQDGVCGRTLSRIIWDEPRKGSW